jgi:uncharacterized protein
MKDLVELIVRQLVSKPDEVQVTETVGEVGTILELRVAKEDVGRVIGKQGRTANAIRVILNAAATRKNLRVVLEIVE